jgi:hypothetical protein
VPLLVSTQQSQNDMKGRNDTGDVYGCSCFTLHRRATPEVIFVSPCECQGFHGKNRWVTMFYSRSHDAVIRVYDSAGNVIETREHTGEFKD